MRKFVNFWLGSARIRVTGPFPERFLNLCGESGIGFWEVREEEKGTLEVTVSRFSLRRVEALAQRALCTVECRALMGFPAQVQRLRKRYAFWTGLALAAACACVLSQFVLIVNVSGNENLSDSIILTELESIGFGVGSYGPAVNERALSNQALLDLEGLSYLNINITGIYAQVEVRERTAVPEIEDPNAPADIVSTVDGVILDVDLLAGQALVGEGQAVLAGEMLISGTNTYESGDGSGAILSSRSERAAGEVWAMTSRQLTACTPLEVTAKEPTQQEKRRHSLRIMKHLIKIYRNSSIFDGKCDTIKTTSALTLPGGIALPLAWETQTFTEYETASAQADPAAAEELLEKQLKERLERLLGEDGTLLSADWEKSEQNGVLTVTLKAACTEQIGQRVERAVPQAAE